MKIVEFDGLPPALRASLGYRTLQPGEFLFRQGDEARSVYLVQSGRLRVVRHTSDGQSFVCFVVRSGETVAEAQLFEDFFGCEGIAETVTRVAFFPKEALLAALREYPAFAEDYMRRLICHADRLKASLELRAIPSSRARILSYLHGSRRAEDGSIILDRHLKDIAEEIGLSAEALYRSLARLEREGEIDRDGRLVRLLRSA